MAPAFWVSLPIPEAIIAVYQVELAVFTIGYSHTIAIAHISVVSIVLGGMLLFLTVSLVPMTEAFRNGGDRLLGIRSPFRLLAPFATHSFFPRSSLPT